MRSGSSLHKYIQVMCVCVCVCVCDCVCVVFVMYVCTSLNKVMLAKVCVTTKINNINITVSVDVEPLPHD